MRRFGFVGCLLVLLAACSNPDAVKKPPAQEPQTTVQEPIPAPPPGPAVGSLEWAVAGPWRPQKERDRDIWRHPQDTLKFCGVDPAKTIIEVWPGGGWYTQILAPWVKENGGHYIAAGLDPQSSPRAAALSTQFANRFADADRYGDISFSSLSATSGDLAPPGSADTVLTFRNVHSWMARGMAEKAFADFYKALKPGGTLCVVEHRLPGSRLQDPQARTGYVQEEMVKALAKEAGFTLAAESQINANPKDKADHPFGVWTLPPVRRSAALGAPENPQFDHSPFDAIGESDRMTLRFIKPKETSEAPTHE